MRVPGRPGGVLGVVPARIGSTRFPGKVLADLGGRPLVCRVAERLAGAARVDRVVVATDSSEVKAAVEGEGLPVVMVTEPCATGTDRVAAAVRGYDARVVVNLQADQALVRPEDIDRVIGRLDDGPSLDLTTLAYPSDDAAAYRRDDVVKVAIDESGRALSFSRAPLPWAGGNALFLHHVGIYCFRRAALDRFASLPQSEAETRESLEQLRAVSNGMAIGVVVTTHASPSVDRPEDLAEVSRILSQGA